MSNIKSTREGENQQGYYTRNNKKAPKEVQEAMRQREARPGDSAVWGGGFNGINMPSVMGGAFRPVRDEQVGFNPRQNSNLTGPKPSVIMNDHEGLKLPKT
jgi:hypothetical protein